MASSNDRFQSLRMSCDRCRFQKLKCTLPPTTSPASGSPCQRCVRAKVACVFSRRAPTVFENKRRSGKNGKRKSVAGSEAMADSGSILGSNQLQFGSPSPMRELVSDENAEDLSSLEALVHVQGWRHHSACEPPPTSTIVNPTSFDNEFLLYDYDTSTSYHQDGGLRDLNMFSHDAVSQELFKKPASVQLQSNVETGSPRLGGTSMVQVTNDETGSVGMGSLELGQNASNCTMMQRLSALMAEMHESLRVLKEGLWTKAMDRYSLNNYPIGGVLQLAQEFANILRTTSFWTTEPSSELERAPLRCAECNVQACGRSPGKTCQLPTPSTHSPRRESSVPAIIGQDMTDTPTRLLILSCYISLTRIYSIVFGHFQDHLSLVPSCTLSNGAAEVELCRGLQLGALPPMNEVYSRTHTAVRMLLDTLRCVEDLIGLPSNLRCARGSMMTTGTWSPESEPSGSNATGGGGAAAEEASSSSWSMVEGDLAMAVLKQEVSLGAGSIEEGFSGLAKKVGLVKRLLRQKMGL